MLDAQKNGDVDDVGEKWWDEGRPIETCVDYMPATGMRAGAAPRRRRRRVDAPATPAEKERKTDANGAPHVRDHRRDDCGAVCLLAS